MRTGHIYYTAEGIKIIDCIEFNDYLRFQDVVSDLDFLAMDLDYEGYGRISETLLKAYVRYSKDFDIFVLPGRHFGWFAVCQRQARALFLKNLSAYSGAGLLI